MNIRPEGPALTLVIVMSTLLAITTIVVALRVFIRIKTRAFGLDDWIMVIGYVCRKLATFFTVN
jgi:hypothetical protein